MKKKKLKKLEIKSSSKDGMSIHQNIEKFFQKNRKNWAQKQKGKNLLKAKIYQ